MLRVVLGRARPDTEWSTKISDIEFNSDSQTARASSAASGNDDTIWGSRGAITTILTIPRSQNIQGAKTELVNHSQGTDVVGVNGEKQHLEIV
jgi:hypothetical protein